MTITKSDAIVVDVDGTLAQMCDRGVYDHEKSIDDTLCFPVATIVQGLHEYYGYHILYVTGRFEKHRDTTVRWFNKNNLPHGRLFMRWDDDYRSDEILKEEIYRKYIEPRYRVEFVLDDRDRVVRMWRSIGLKCLQVADGNF